MRGYAEDRLWADRFIPQIKRRVGPLLLSEAPLELDQKEATDLIILIAADMRIAARMRHHEYLLKYPHDFTVRLSRERGTETEFSKIIKGFGDWMFYGFCDAAEQIVIAWRVLDLNVFRRTLADPEKMRTVRWGTKPNKGDGTYFNFYDVRIFPEAIQVANGRKG